MLRRYLKTHYGVYIGLLLFSSLVLAATTYAVQHNEKLIVRKTVRCCVIGGMTATTTWQKIAGMFEAETGYTVEVVSTGPRTKISKPFRRGAADLLTMHSGDITTNLIADGYGVNMRPWARNDIVILGPPADPAGIRGLQDGAEAFRRIAKTKSNYVDGMGAGKRDLCHKLWKKAGLRPIGSWVLKDGAFSRHRLLTYAAEKEAYVVFGRTPVKLHKIPYHDLQILVEGDPDMRRPYVVMEANPEFFKHTNYRGARALSDFLLSEKVQTFIAAYGKDKNDGYPYFYPVWPHDVKRAP